MRSAGAHTCAPQSDAENKRVTHRDAALLDVSLVLLQQTRHRLEQARLVPWACGHATAAPRRHVDHQGGGKHGFRRRRACIFEMLGPNNVTR